MKTKDNCIRSTGSDMTRFFFTIDEAISLVETALKNIQHIHSSILSIPMKTATIKSFLDEFCSIHECDYSIVEQRGGERNHEFLIGEAELMYSKSIEFENQTYFQITPNKKQKDALRSPVSSATSPRLTKEEIRSAILNQPVFV